MELPPFNEDLIWKKIHNLNEEIFQRVTQQTNEHISKLLDTRLAPLKKTQKKLEWAIGKAKKKKLKQKNIRASSSSNVVPLPPPLSPPSIFACL
ncbi:hypothetical protein AHAS_Ahas16G0155000 [Arachis hypogaea]